MTYAKNKGADQHSHPLREIKTIVFRCVDTILTKASVYTNPYICGVSEAEGPVFVEPGLEVIKLFSCST